MFGDLIESNRPIERSLTQSFISAIVHGVMIASAVLLSRSTAAAVLAKPLSEAVFVNTKVPPPPPPSPIATPVTTQTHVPPPLGFKTISPPMEIPNSIPPVDLTSHFNAHEYTGIGVPGGSIEGVIGGLATDVGSAINSEAYTSSQVDDPIEIVSQPNPKYPAALRVAGIPGTVTVEFVVGVDGKAEIASMRIDSTTNARFNDAAIETIRNSVFKAARMRGKPVRVLVKQNVNFSLTG